MDPSLALAAVAALAAVIAGGLAVRSHIQANQAQAAAEQLAARVAAAERQLEHRAEEDASRAAELLRRLQQLSGEQQALVRAAAQRASATNRRLEDHERRLTDLDQIASPPPIPSGRTATRLEDLRATLRAQAAEAAERDEQDDEVEA